jgi:formate C-acetyltransferase
MWALVVTFLLPLELALNNGRPFAGELPVTLKTMAPATYTDVEAIQAATLRFADELLAFLIMRHGEITRREGMENPDPYLSALLGGGIPGRDRLLSGPRYHTANVDAFAIVNVADALTAIDRVVFREGRCPLANVVAAVKNNFAGEEALRRELLAAPKYGNGDPDADRRVAALADGFAASVRRHDAGPIVYMPSFHTLDAHVGVGKRWGASADGRLAGEPLAKNIGPTQGRDHSGLTALLRSAAAIDQQFFYGGQAIDLHLDAALVAESATARKFQAALQTYFQMGGLLVQVNGVSVEALKAAMANPEAHGDLTVRIGGFSMRFVQLGPDAQREMILRFESCTRKSLA